MDDPQSLPTFDVIEANSLASGSCDLADEDVVGPIVPSVLSEILLRGGADGTGSASPAPAPAVALPASVLSTTKFTSVSRDASRLQFTGVLTGLLPSNAAAEPTATSIVACLFDLPATAARDAERHLVMSLTLPAALSPADFLAPYSRYAATVAPFLSGGGDVSLVASIAFTGGALLVSTLDFSDPVYPDVTLAEPFADFLPRAQIGAGVNFKASLGVADSVAGVFALLSLPRQLAVAATIGSTNAGLALELFPTIGTPSFSVSSFAFTLTALGFTFSLAGLGQEYPDVTVIGQTKIGGGGVKFVADLDLAAPALRVATTESLSLPGLADLAGLLGGGDLAARYLPANAASYGAITLDALSFRIVLSPFELTDVAVTLSTQNPVGLLPGAIAVTPVLNVEVTYPMDSARRSEKVSLAGQWMLGSTTFNTLLSLSDKTFSAEMAVGESLDVSELLDKIIPGVQLPSRAIDLIDLELTADWDAKSFDAEIDVGSDWSFSIAGVSLAVTGLGMTLSYADGAVTDCELSGFLAIAGLDLSALAIYDGANWTLRATTQPSEALSLTAIVERLLDDLPGIGADLTHVPDEFQNVDIAIKDLFLEHSTAGGGSTTFYCSLDHSIALSSSFSLDTLFVRMDTSSAGMVMQGQAMVTVAGVTLFLSAQKEAEGWLFSGGAAAGAAIPIGKLIEDVAAKFGVAVSAPDAVGKLTLKNLTVSFDTSSKSFSAGGEFGAAAPGFGDLLAAGGVAAPDLPALPAAACSASYDAAKRQATFAVSLTGIWSLGPLSLDQLSVQFMEQRAPAASGAGGGLTASVSARITIGGVVMSADIAHGPAGWTIAASAVPGPDGIPLGQLLDGLAKDLGLSAPEVLGEVTLEAFSLNYVESASAKETKVTLAGGLPIGPGVRLSMNLDSKSGGAEAIDGSLSIGAMTLALQKTANGVTAQWRSEQGGGLGVSDLASAFGLDLPAGAKRIDFKLTKVDLAYEAA